MAQHPGSSGHTAPRLRSRGAVALFVLCAVLAIVLLGDAVIRAGLGQALLLAPWLLLVLWAVYAIGVASHIEVRPDGVLVQNALRRTFAPWARVERIVMRWQVEITLDDGTTVTCFGGPARMRPQRLGPGRTLEDAGGQADDTVAALRRAKADAASAGAALAGADAPVRRGWDVPAVVALLVIVVWTAAAVMIAYA